MRSALHITIPLWGILCLLTWNFAAVAAEPPPAAARAAGAAAQQEKILVLPFTPLASSGEEAWRARPLQQMLLEDLASAAPGRVVSGEAAAGDVAGAVVAGRQASARYVVTGTFAVNSPEVRITVQVVDVQAGQAVHTFRLTGSAADAFQLEDDLTSKLREGLGLGPAGGAARDEEPAATAPARGRIILVIGPKPPTPQPAEPLPPPPSREELMRRGVERNESLYTARPGPISGPISGPIIYHPSRDSCHSAGSFIMRGGIPVEYGVKVYSPSPSHDPCCPPRRPCRPSPGPVPYPCAHRR
jgi:TolB-like protein